MDNFSCFPHNIFYGNNENLYTGKTVCYTQISHLKCDLKFDTESFEILSKRKLWSWYFISETFSYLVSSYWFVSSYNDLSLKATFLLSTTWHFIYIRQLSISNKLSGTRPLWNVPFKQRHICINAGEQGVVTVTAFINVYSVHSDWTAVTLGKIVPWSNVVREMTFESTEEIFWNSGQLNSA